jgi:hypothetical protein
MQEDDQMKMFTGVLAVFFLTISLASAEVQVQPQPANLSALKTVDFSPKPFGLDEKFKGLFESGRLSFKNTVGFNFRSGGFGGASQYYLNTISYRANSKTPLSFEAQVGLEHVLQGNSAFGSSLGNNTKLVIPYVGMFYQPRENIQIEIQFSNSPYYRSGGRYRY